MATLTIRNLSDELIERLKTIAYHKKHSMEQEVREVLEIKYAGRLEVVNRIQNRWQRLPKTSAKEVQSWRHQGRL